MRTVPWKAAERLKVHTWSCKFKFAPCFNSNLTASIRSCCDATISGVFPRYKARGYSHQNTSVMKPTWHVYRMPTSSCKFTSAPCFTSFLITVKCPCCDANIKGVLPRYTNTSRTRSSISHDNNTNADQIIHKKNAQVICQKGAKQSILLPQSGNNSSNDDTLSAKSTCTWHCSSEATAPSRPYSDARRNAVHPS